MQALSVSPLKKFGLDYLPLITIAPALLLITQAIAYYLNVLVAFALGYSYPLAFLLALLLEFIMLTLLAKKIFGSKQVFIPFRIHLKFFVEFVPMFLFSTTSIILFIILYPTNVLLTLGDTPALVKVTEYLVIYEQEFFQLTYLDEITSNAVVGLFYPSAGFILGSIAANYLLLPYSSVTIYSLLFAAFYSYTFSIYFLIKLLKIPLGSILLFFIFLANVFPIGLIISGNLSTIYGIIGSISLLGLFILIAKYVSTIQRSFIVLLSCVILIPLHPSSSFTFLIILWTCSVLFDLPKIVLSFKPLYVTLLLLLSISIFTIQPSFLYNIVNTLRALYLSLPSNIALDMFLLDELIFERASIFIWKNIITLSAWHLSFPVFFVLLIVLIYSYFKFNKSISYFVPIIIFLSLIIPASMSGIDHPIKFLSILSTPYYQSPLRITHLGVFIYLFYLARFLVDYKKINNFTFD